MSAVSDVSIIIVNYNGKKYIDVLLDGLLNLRHTDFSYEIVFVDNASSDDSVQYLREKTKAVSNLKIVCSDENLGFAGGNNLGISNAEGRYIVLLNNDTRPEADWLENLYHYAVSHPEVVIVNSKLVFFYDFLKVRFRTTDKIILNRNLRINTVPYQVDSKFCKNCLCEKDRLVCFGHTEIYIPLLQGSEQHVIEIDPIQSCEKDMIVIGERQLPIESVKPLSLLLTENEVQKERITLIQNAGSGINERLDGYDIGFCEEDGEKFRAEYELANGCGASIMFKKQDFIRCGGFDERFFMYYEDTDLSFRMKKDGRKIMYCPSSVVRHIHAGSSGEWSPFFVFHVSKNKLLFVANNYGYKAFMKYFVRQMLSAIKHKDKHKLKGTMKALKLVSGDIFHKERTHCPHLKQE